MYQQYLLRPLRLALVLLHMSVGMASAGILSGTVTDATGQSRIKDAVVWAEPTGPMPTFSAPVQHAEMAQINLAFAPLVLPVLVGTTVEFPNRDKVYHSVFSFSRLQRFEFGLYKPGEQRAETFRKVGVIKLFCNIHDCMHGAIVVLPTPYFSTTRADGAFSIAATPAGDYTVQVWHGRLQGDPHTVSVPATGTVELTFPLRSKRRRK